jgi:broad specificity phosphatase PhoE
VRAWLIRHGESESNAGLPTQGPGASPLTPIGHEQADLVAQVFREPPVLIVASPFRRAIQTAEPTIRRFPEVPYEEWPVQEFTYLGKLHAFDTTAKERLPHAEEYWRRSDPTYVHGDDGESFTDLMGRVDDAVARVSARPDGLVAVFTHGLFMRALAWSVLTGRPPGAEVSSRWMRDYRRFADSYRVPNGCILELRRNAVGALTIGPVITYLPPSLTTPP